LDPGGRDVAGLAGNRAPVDRDDEVTGLDSDALRRRVLEDAGYLQPPLSFHDRHADARELAARRLFEELVLGGGEVVRKAAVKRTHHPLQRGVAKLLVGDLL